MIHIMFHITLAGRQYKEVACYKESDASPRNKDVIFSLRGSYTILRRLTASFTALKLRTIYMRQKFNGVIPRQC
jgi:hypothetical protein